VAGRPCIDETGNRHGKWTVLFKCDGTTNGNAVFRCRCDCGTEKDITGCALRNGGTTQCAACNAGRGGSHSKGIQQPRGWAGHEELTGQTWKGIANNALVRDLAFEVTPEYVWDLFISQNRTCAITGRFLTMHTKTERGTASLDRIDSSKGYFEGNLQWVHKAVNLAKMAMPEDEFFSLCDDIINHQGALAARDFLFNALNTPGERQSA
jgi:hypothetical protein